MRTISPSLTSLPLGAQSGIAIAQKECVELHFTHKDKAYFAIGFANKTGGYELRNIFFKGCIAPKSFTIIKAKEQRQYFV